MGWPHASPIMHRPVVGGVRARQRRRAARGVGPKAAVCAAHPRDAACAAFIPAPRTRAPSLSRMHSCFPPQLLTLPRPRSALGCAPRPPARAHAPPTPQPHGTPHRTAPRNATLCSRKPRHPLLGWISCVAHCAQGGVPFECWRTYWSSWCFLFMSTKYLSIKEIDQKRKKAVGQAASRQPPGARRHGPPSLVKGPTTRAGTASRRTHAGRAVGRGNATPCAWEDAAGAVAHARTPHSRLVPVPHIAHECAAGGRYSAAAARARLVWTPWHRWASMAASRVCAATCVRGVVPCVAVVADAYGRRLHQLDLPWGGAGSWRAVLARLGRGGRCWHGVRGEMCQFQHAGGGLVSGCKFRARRQMHLPITRTQARRCAYGGGGLAPRTREHTNKHDHTQPRTSTRTRAPTTRVRVYGHGHPHRWGSPDSPRPSPRRRRRLPTTPWSARLSPRPSDSRPSTSCGVVRGAAWSVRQACGGAPGAVRTGWDTIQSMAADYTQHVREDGRSITCAASLPPPRWSPWRAGLLPRGSPRVQWWRRGVLGKAGDAELGQNVAEARMLQRLRYSYSYGTRFRWNHFTRLSRVFAPGSCGNITKGVVRTGPPCVRAPVEARPAFKVPRAAPGPPGPRSANRHGRTSPFVCCGHGRGNE